MKSEWLDVCFPHETANMGDYGAQHTTVDSNIAALFILGGQSALGDILSIEARNQVYPSAATTATTSTITSAIDSFTDEERMLFQFFANPSENELKYQNSRPASGSEDGVYCPVSQHLGFLPPLTTTTTSAPLADDKRVVAAAAEDKTEWGTSNPYISLTMENKFAPTYWKNGKGSVRCFPHCQAPCHNANGCCKSAVTISLCMDRSMNMDNIQIRGKITQREEPTDATAMESKWTDGELVSSEIISSTSVVRTFQICPRTWKHDEMLQFGKRFVFRVIVLINGKFVQALDSTEFKIASTRTRTRHTYVGDQQLYQQPILHRHSTIKPHQLMKPY